jgi:hypothetical protein
MYQVASEEYWNIHDALDAANEVRNSLVESYDPTTGTRVTTDEMFPAGPVSITLTVDRPPLAQQPLELAALLGGKTASAGSPYQYSTDVSDLAQGTDPLGLEIQAR